MPITKTRALGSWKNFVLKFRKEFDTRFPSEPENTSLSLLVSAMAVKLSVIPAANDGTAHSAGNPKYRNKTPLDLVESIKVSSDLHKTVKRSMPDELPYELSNAASQYEDEFAKILAAIDGCDVIDDPFIIGYTYQYWRDSDRKDAQSGIQSADKQIDKDRLIAFTQIYTPEWVVSFILANTLLSRLDGNSVDRNSRFGRWLIPRTGADQAKLARRCKTVTILDPACGAGNFLIGAFDALFELHNQAGHAHKESLETIFEKQLHGCDIDAVALSVAATALAVRCLQMGMQSVPRLNGLALARPQSEPLLGSLSNDFKSEHPLSKKYDVVVTNPPYIGRKLISRELKTLIKSRFPHSHQDLSAAFFERCLTLLKPSGRVGLITQASVMFLPSHSKLRDLILDNYRLIAAVDAGPGVFPLQGGEKVNSAILVVEKPDDTADGACAGSASFLRLKDENGKFDFLESPNAETAGVSPAFARTLIDPVRFKQFRGSAFNYFIPPAVAEVLKHSKKLERTAEVRQGLATTDNDRFVKLIWQVPREELGRIWFPYVKGAGGQRFYSPVKHVVNWKDNGKEIKKAVDERYPYLKGKTAWVVKNESFYFRPGLCFSFVNTRGIAVRNLPAGCIFDVGASAIFSDADNYLLAYLSSSYMVALASSLNPTINYQVGDLKRFPVMQSSPEVTARLTALACQCLAAKKEITELLDPSAWFDPFSGLSNSPQLYGSITETGFAQAFLQFAAKVEKLDWQIRAYEFEIDELVLETLAESERWNKFAKAEVVSWIEEFGCRINAPLPPNLPRLFADNLIVHRFLNAYTSGSQRSGFSAGQDLPWPITAQREAVESLLGTSLPNYLAQLQSRINKTFLGFPPVALRSIQLTEIDS